MSTSDYVKIRLEFVPAVIDAFENTADDSQWKVQITCPSLNSCIQSLPTLLKFKLRNSEPLVLALLPTDFYSPRQKYVVDYVNSKQPSLNFTEEWIVPVHYPIRTQVLTIEPSKLRYPLAHSPLDVLELNSTLSLPPYVLEGNALVFLQPPARQELVTLEYVCYLTREELVYDPNKHQNLDINKIYDF
jgi:hypothetical protein